MGRVRKANARGTSSKPVESTGSVGKGRRAQILAAASELFAERGYAAAGIDEIGKAAGITGGAVYRHFESKLELFLALIRPLAERGSVRIAEIAGVAESSEEALRLLVENLIDLILEDRAVMAAIWRELRHVDAEGDRWTDRMHAVHTAEFVRNLRAVRPELSNADAKARATAFYGIAFTAADLETTLPDTEIRALLAHLGLGVLRA